MAKMFYSLEEALEKLGCDESTLKAAVRDGKLREFRDAGKVNYKSDEIDKLAADSGGGAGTPPPPPPADDAASDTGPLKLGDELELSASLGPIGLADTGADTGADNPFPDLTSAGSGAGAESGGSIGLGDSLGDSLGEIGLADTGVNLGGSGSAPGPPGLAETDIAAETTFNLADTGDMGDQVSIEEPDNASSGNKKDDTVVSSVGVSVFDEEEVSDDDPMAKTVLTGTAGGTGLEGVGSGSGLLDLTRESDDTSLGAELLDEIYPGGDEGATVEMGEATRAGLESAIPDETPAGGEPVTEDAFQPADPGPASVAATAAAPSRTVVTQTIEYAPDAFANGATGMLAVALLIMVFTGLPIAAALGNTWPSILDFVYGKLWMFGAGALVLSGAALGLGIFLGKRSGG